MQDQTTLKKMEAKTSGQQTRSQFERDGVPKLLEWADAQQRRCLLTRDRAYRKIWFERSAATRCSAVDKKARDISQVRFRSNSGSKK